MEEEFQGDFELRKRKNANLFTMKKRDYDLIKPMDDIEEKKYFIRNILPTSSQDVSNGIVPVKQITLTRSTILKAIEEQAKQNTSLADKYLDVIVRNFHGEFNEVPTLYHEKLINDVLKKWQDWYDKSPNFRDSPLLYMCYICNMGWWRLHPFREHIKEHDVELFDIKPKLKDNEFFMIAFANQLRRKKPKSTLNLKIYSNCWKCGKSATFHNFKIQNAMYKCEGCNIELITCTRLSQHESICKQYLEMKCKKLGIEMSEFKICPVCFRCSLTQEQFDVHMIERHSVRSDDPISIETKMCIHCKRKYYIYKYHDCPARYKNTKCEFCFRKFITRSTQLMHIKLTRDANCIVCGEAMRECMLLEHMLHHSKNYMLLHWCGKCRKNVLHVTNVHSNSHMKFHGKFVNLKTWSARMLLPLKCVTGEIVDSATIINIPKENLAIFMNGLEDEKIIHITSDDSDDDIINLDEDSEPQPDTTEVKNNEVDKCDLNTLQAQLDAEIEKDIEMEAAILNVFKSSECYQRFLEKENEEPIEDYQFNADRRIIRNPDVTTIMLDSDSDDDNVNGESE